MRTRHIIAIAAISLPAIFSCTEEELQIREPDETPMVVGENQMGVTIHGIDEVFSWKSGDEITVIGDNGTEKFSILDTYTTTKAKFSGTDMESAKYTIIYSSHGETLEELESRSYSDQKQSANGSTDHLDFDIVVKDVSSYKNVTFSEEWATENGGELLMSNCLKFNLEFPGNVLELSSLGLRSDSPVFHSDNSAVSTTDSLLVTFPEAIDVAVNDNKITVYMLASWQPIQITEENEIKVWALYGDRPYLATLPAMNLTMKGGSVYEFNISSDAWELYDMSEGSKWNPYKMTTAEDMMSMSGKLKDNAVTYFSLTKDIDMAGNEWTPLQTDASAFKSIYFDGQGHKISNLTINGEYEHASFAGILEGTVKNVTFENPSVTSTIATASTAAIVAGYAGRPNGESSATIENVTVTGATLSVTQQAATPAGLIAGQARNLTVKDCKAYGTVTHAGKDAECNVGGFIGRLDGTCSVSGCTSDVYVTSSSFSRVFGVFIGSIHGESVVENCTAAGTLDALQGSTRYSGGLVGNIAAKSTIRNCTFTGDIKGGEKCFGGLAGSIFTGAAETLIENCHVTGNVEGAASGTYYGGLIGEIMLKTTVRNCSFNGDLTGSAGYLGGISGSVDEGAAGTVIEDCDVIINIESGTDASKGRSYLGGIIGRATGTVTVLDCSSAGNIVISHANDYVGGIIGGSDATSTNTAVERCSFSGKISGNNRCYIAGIFGLVQGPGTIIRNCWSEGTISDVNYGIGGITGEMLENTSVENCFSTMDIVAGHGIGGIAGRADNNVNPASETGLGIKVSGCIAWNESISSSKMPDGIDINRNFSAGAVVGRGNMFNINENCWRRPDMNFSCLGGDMNTLYDQENSDADTPLEFKGFSGTYYCPYNGKAAAQDATISSVARQLGWDESVWDLSGDTPVLR